MDEKNQKSNSALREEAVLQFWKENEIFEKSLAKVSPQGEYVFYEGPPTANGKPGIHHLEARAFKDAMPRYKTMRGFHVDRKGGWDTHGLPVELQVEKKLGLTSKKAIEEYGVAQFNRECKESVWEYVDLWEKFTDRIGYWVDQKNAYVTYHNNYIESVWNVIKNVNDKNLLYKDYKIVPWCPRCGTTLSSHELAQGYVDVKDLSVYAKFKVKGQDNTYILAWTTTPWTLPGNVALAVGEKMDYVKVEIKTSSDAFAQVLGRGEREPVPDHSQKHTDSVSFTYILAKERLIVIEGEYKIIEELKGKDLIGLEYEPLYPYLSNTISDLERQKLDKAFKVYGASFVTTEDGTGVVHTAVMYGVDDFILGNEIGLPKHHMVGLDGKFLAGTDFLEGRFVRDEEVAVDIIKDLAHRGLLFKKEKYEHSYPHCWRCKTALIYYARDSWYIGMSTLKKELLKENEDINWEPNNIRDGRFGEWLKDIKDWAISRERYWGTPLPVWTCQTCQKREVIGGIDDLKSKTKKSGNNYFIMRHGEADCNVSPLLMASGVSEKSKLTEKGLSQVKEAAKNFNQKIDVIISSPFERTRMTTKIMCQHLNFPEDKVIYENNIHEWVSSSKFVGKDREINYNYYSNVLFNDPFEVLPDSESFAQVIERMGNFIYGLEKKYAGQNILIVGHSAATRALDFIMRGFTFENLPKEKEVPVYLKNAEIRKLDFTPLPHNEKFELDLHKPYIDEVKLSCSCGGQLVREKEVMDVWLDSGTMPFSQSHYPFENKDLVEKGGYPADYISEAMDQTRGWFYTLHAVGILMGKGKAYKNVICLGLLLDAKGKKMSKSLGNIVNPIIMMDKYGADTLRLWMYSVNQPGESKSFDEKIVSELHNKVFNLLYNVLAFYELYRDKNLEGPRLDLKEGNILDQWILARLNQLGEIVTTNMDSYKLLEPVRSIRDFIDDLSTWYVRRSRERIKEGDASAKETLYFVLKTLAQLMAPFAPFAAEDIWQKLKISRVSMDSTRHDSAESDVESVHLSSWPEFMQGGMNVLNEMEEVREVVTLGLQARQKASLPVRQPLGELRITNYEIKETYTEIIKDELNVKGLKYLQGEEKKVELDTVITTELKKEGQCRELIRSIQDLRKKKGLNPGDIISLEIETVEGKDMIDQYKAELLRAVGAKDLKMIETDGVEVKIDNIIFKIKIL